jgi:hypothetical protein
LGWTLRPGTATAPAEALKLGGDPFFSTVQVRTLSTDRSLRGIAGTTAAVRLPPKR